MIYEYKCSSCHTVSKKMYKIGTAPRTIKCKECGKKAKKLLSLSQIVFVGDNWPDKERKN